jgi:hypothetical protein
MTNAKKLIPAIAFAVALAPLAGAAGYSYGTPQNTAYLSNPAVFNHLAANSKGRPAEFAPAAAGQVAVDSKGRPGEFGAASAQIADNSKGRPAEFNPDQVG